MSCTHSSATRRAPMPVVRSGAENPKPGSEGTTTSKHRRDRRRRRRIASGAITSLQSQNVQGQPCVRIRGVGDGPFPRTWTKWTRHPVELDPELREGIDRRLLRAPVEILRPVAHHLLEPAALDAVLPVSLPKSSAQRVVRNRRRRSSSCDAGTSTRNGVARMVDSRQPVDAERSGRRSARRQVLPPFTWLLAPLRLRS